MRFVSTIFVVFAALAAQDFDDLARRAEAALNGKPEEAARLYGQAVGLRPSWAEGWFYLGASEYRLNKYAEAKEAFLRATALAAENGAAWGFLGLCEYDLQEYPAALKHILKAEVLPLPENPQFFSSLRLHAAKIYLQDSDFTASIDQLRPLAAAGDSSAAVVETLGLAALTLTAVPSGKLPLVDLAGRAIWNLYAHHTEEAVTLFDTLEAHFPTEPGVHYLVGISFVERDSSTAMSEFHKELEVSPKHVLARVQIAVLDIKGGDPKSALAPAKEAVKIEPGNFLCHLALGRALLGLDQAGEATHEFEEAVKLAPGNAYTHFYLGQVYRESGKESESRKEFSEFSRLKGQSGDVH